MRKSLNKLNFSCGKKEPLVKSAIKQEKLDMANKLKFISFLAAIALAGTQAVLAQESGGADDVIVVTAAKIEQNEADTV